MIHRLYIESVCVSVSRSIGGRVVVLMLVVLRERVVVSSVKRVSCDSAESLEKGRCD